VTVYNERYSKSSPIQLGDFEKLYMALAVVDDYLLWLTQVRCVTLPGAGNGVRMQVRKARESALVLYQGFANDAGAES
jgi:hypothetical protein